MRFTDIEKFKWKLIMRFIDAENFRLNFGISLVGFIVSYVKLIFAECLLGIDNRVYFVVLRIWMAID